MSKVLFFQTYQYPYLPGEYFIESEIDHLAEAFDRVLVYPDHTQWWQSPQPARKLPEGVELCDINEAPRILRIWWTVMGLVKTVPFILKYRSTWPGEERTPRASIRQALRSSLKCVAAKPAIEWLLKRKGVSSAICYGYWRHDAVGALGLLKQEGQIQQLHVRCHRSDIYFSERYPFEVMIHQAADGVYPVSDDGKRYLEEVKGLPAERIQVQRLGVTLPEKCSRASTDGVLRVVSCSNIIPVKRVGLIAEVVGALGVPCEWTHIGDGPEETEVKAIAASFGSEIKANFLGRISNPEVLAYYQANPVDLFINLSESEGVPVSIMEALAHGVPVVATDVGGSAEVIDEANGRVVEIDAPVDTVVEAIRSLFPKERDPEVARAAARKMAEQRCSSVANYSAFCDILKGE